MESIKVIIKFMGSMSAFFLTLCKIRLISDKDKEILALRSQLALFHQQSASGKIKAPRATLTFRMAWVFLSRHFKDWKDWKDVLIIVKPETVIVTRGAIYKPQIQGNFSKLRSGTEYVRGRAVL